MRVRFQARRFWLLALCLTMCSTALSPLPPLRCAHAEWTPETPLRPRKRYLRVRETSCPLPWSHAVSDHTVGSDQRGWELAVWCRLLVLRRSLDYRVVGRRSGSASVWRLSRREGRRGPPVSCAQPQSWAACWAWPGDRWRPSGIPRLPGGADRTASSARDLRHDPPRKGATSVAAGEPLVPPGDGLLRSWLRRGGDE